MPAIGLGGPTKFSSVLEAFNAHAFNNQQGKVYQVLLILTDGEIHDMSEVKRLVVNASKLPTSIIIVGVGNEAFELMEELDSDD